MQRLLLCLSAAAAAAAALPPPAQLASTALCTAAGYPDLTSYRYSLPVSSPAGATTNSTPIFLPYYASAPLSSVSPSTTTAVLFLHGLSGNAQDYFCAGMRASAGRAPSVLVLAPWFGNQSSDGAYWRAAAADSATLFWSNSRWSTGGSNTAPPRQWSTSFDLLDALLLALPRSITLATVAGFSAGAQLSGRYAFATPLGTDAPQQPHVRFIVSDPGSYLYLSPQRPAPACRPLQDTGAQHTCGAFEAPPPAQDCGSSAYNDYKYGLQQLDYLNPYLTPLASNATALQQAVERFAARDVRFILGTGDACNCNSQGYQQPLEDSCAPLGGSLSCAPNAFGGPGCCDTWPDSAASNALDVTCPAMLQGSNRLQRGLNYVAHLRHLFPAAATPQLATASFGHNASGLFFSAAFQGAAYTL